jgi:hypothetical protein
MKDGQVAKEKSLHVSLDEGCNRKSKNFSFSLLRPFSCALNLRIAINTCTKVSYRVYIDDSGIVWDATLNQTNAASSNNKFYRIQLLVDSTKTNFHTWTRWGRIGEPGQNSLLGNGSLMNATHLFEKTFKDGRIG